MSMKTAMRRALRAMREDMRLYIASVSSLTVAFLCFSAALLSLSNLRAVGEAWASHTKLSVYLHEGARGEDVAGIKLRLSAMPEVRRVVQRSKEEARAAFLDDGDEALADIPVDAFPASLEVELMPSTAAERVEAIAAGLAHSSAVEEVETYRRWRRSLEALVGTGRVLFYVVAGLVLLSAFLVVANTIRFSVAGRRAEVEVLRLCGASDAYVRSPFLLEGALQGALAAAIGLGLLLAFFFAVRGPAETALGLLAEVRPRFLDPLMCLALLLGGGLVGALASHLSLRRHLRTSPS